MSGTQLWLLTSLAFASLTSLADGAPLKVMTAPNLLRVGTAENIFVECQDCSGEDQRVEIIVMNHPTKLKRLASTTVTLTAANSFQQFGQITLPAAEFSKDPNLKQYVYLQAQFPDRLLEKVVLVSFQSGYIFIQTDKTIYTPDTKVYYRLFAVTPRMEAVDTSESDLRCADVEIVTPDDIVLPLGQSCLHSGIFSGSYQLGEVVSPGLWKVVARFQTLPQQSYSAEFEVKEYVLPSFEVKLTPRSSIFYVDSPELIVNIKATYLFGEEVDGAAFVVFGVMQEGQKKSFPSSLQRVMIENGNGAVTLRREHITQTFPNILPLVGSSIYVAVSVITESGGEMVEAELRGIQIITSPYTINFRRTPKYFKPGMPFDVTVEVINPDKNPAQGVPVVVDPGNVKGVTSANGVARLTINTVPGSQTLSITAKTMDPSISAERQATASMAAQPYVTNSNSYIRIGVDTAEVRLGDNLRIQLEFNMRSTQSSDITYLILSRGQLVKYDRFKAQGFFLLITLVVPITKDMLPSFRIVAYYHPSDTEVVSDSVWVDVKDTCMGSLKLEPSRPIRSNAPRSVFSLKVTGDPEATVGLVAVDKGVYILNNQHRLTQKKIWDIVEKSDTGCTPGGGKDSMGVFYDAGLVFESSAGSGTPYRLDDGSYMDSNEIVTRTIFPESWLWKDIKLPPCPGQNPNCASTSSMSVPLPDSITTWQFTGISLSRTQGICVGDPLEVIVRKDFFIDLRLPYSAVRGEQLEVKAILHNYTPDPEPITVRVDMTEVENICSAANKRGRYRQEVNVGPQTTATVPFIIIPMKEGQFNIEVKAAVRDSSLTDGITKMLQVVPEGVLVKSPLVVVLDPVKTGTGGKQEEILNSAIPKKDLVPNTSTITQISITGRQNKGVENVISGHSMGTLIYQPSGDGETNMIHMTLPVIATTYLDKTKQWDTVGFDKRNEAIQHLRTGFNNELHYRKSDESFCKSGRLPSSTWLTAYVVKVFSMAISLTSIRTNVICDAVKFLIFNTQQPDGQFREIGKVDHGEMTGDVFGTDSDASMTAFCLIAIQESRSLCSLSITTLYSSVDKAVTYLEKRLPSLTNPYAVAMTSYALANEGKLNRGILYKFASPESSHWPIIKGNLYTLEATAYALLALVRATAFEDARPVVRWLNQQQKVNGGYGSTQATMMVYQAVAEYWTMAEEPDYDLNVDVLLPGRSIPNKYKFNRENHFTTRTMTFNGINQDVKVTATGSGEATLTMVSYYYVLLKEKESDCQKFDMSVTLIPEKPDNEEMIYTLTIEVLYKDRTRDATMTILDIGLLTGFTVNTNDLDTLSKGRGRIISKYEMNTVLSERGSLIIYLDKVSHTRTEEISFRLHQKLKVGVLQPAAVSVYEYYDAKPCVKFYHKEKKAGEIDLLCINNVCICAEEKCVTLKQGRISSAERMAKCCESTQFSKTDFAYKVRLEDLSADNYTMQVLEVIKKECHDAAPESKLHIFFSFPHCRNVLDVQKGKTYLIMGTSRDIHSDDQSQSYQYVLGERTWIEYWPTEAECRTVEHRITCVGLKEMVLQYTAFGCQE